jgi:hypothetical protein
MHWQLMLLLISMSNAAEHFFGTKELSEHLGLQLDLNDKQIKGIAKRFKNNKSIAMEWINNSFLSDELKVKYKSF